MNLSGLPRLISSFAIAASVPTALSAATVDTPTIQPERGYYDAPVAVTISSSTPGAVIRYSTDGTPPTATTGQIWAGPMTVAASTIIRAAAFADGMTPSRVKTTSILFTADVVRQAADGLPPAGWPSDWGYPGNSHFTKYGMDPRVVGPLGSATAAAAEGDLRQLPTVCLTGTLSDVFGPGGFYSNANQYGPNDPQTWPDGSSKRYERPMSLEFIDPLTGNDWQIDAGVRIRGSYSASSVDRNPKHAFRLFFRSAYGDPKLDHPIFGDHAAASFNTLDLRCPQNNSWHFEGNGTDLMLNDEYVRDLQLAMGQPAERTRPCQVFLNGMYWGLYEFVERPDADFAASYAGGEPEDFDVIKAESPDAGDGRWRNNITDGSWDRWVQLCDAIKTGVRTDGQPDEAITDATLKQIQGLGADGRRDWALPVLVDVDNLIDYMLVVYFSANIDGPTVLFDRTVPNNYFGFTDKAGLVGWRFVAHDNEWSLNKSWYWDNTGPSDFGDRSNVSRYDQSHPQWFFERLTTNAEFRLRVADRARRHFLDNGVLTTNAAMDRFSAWMERIRPGVSGESARWGGAHAEPPLTRDDHWIPACQKLLTTWLQRRSGEVLDQLRDDGDPTSCEYLYPSTAAPTFSLPAGAVTAPAVLTIDRAHTSGAVFYTIDGRDPREPFTGLAQGWDGGTSTLLTLTDSTVVKARTRSGSGRWSAVTQAVYRVAPADGQVRVSELMYHPRASGSVSASRYEFIELTNQGPSTVDLSGARFTRGVSFTFPEGTLLPVGGYLVLPSSAEHYNERYGTRPLGRQSWQYAGSLADSGERLTLVDGDDRILLDLTYGDTPPWPLAADGSGCSLVDAAGDQNLPGSWRASTEIDGSPGESDQPATGGPWPAVVINEALTHTDAPLVDAIELHNPTAREVDLGGWWLSDDRNALLKYRILPGTVIPAGGMVVIVEDTDDDPTNNADLPPEFFGRAFSLSSLGDEINLVAPDYSLIDRVTFGAAGNGVSFGRHQISTGEVLFPPLQDRSLGATNGPARVGPLVLNELHYNPTVGGVPFIELLNRSGSPVVLNDPRTPGNRWDVNGAGWTLPDGLVVPAGGLVVAIPAGSDTAAFRIANAIPATVPVLTFNASLDKGGERISLRRPDGTEPNGTVPMVAEDSVRYDDVAPWPVAPDGTGPSLQRREAPAFADDPASWRASPASGGSPGRPNRAAEAPGTAVASRSGTANQITWPAAAGHPVTYRVERDAGAGWDLLASVDGAVTSVIDPAPPVEVFSRYRVIAQVPDGDSVPSGVSNGLAGMPAGPTGLTAVADADGIDLAWEDRSGGETGFTVERLLSAGAWSVVASPVADATSWRDSSVTTGALARYRVRAVNGAGVSAWSEEARAIRGAVVPGAPLSLTAARLAPDAILLSWSAGSGSINAYVVEHALDDGSFADLASLAVDARSFTHAGLAEETRHRYRIRVEDGLGGEDRSQPTAALATQPAAPTDLTAQGTLTGIALAWRDRSALETSQSVERSADGNVWIGIGSPTADAESWIDGAAAEGQTWIYRVLASNEAGVSTPSVTAAARIPRAPVAPTPTVTPSGLVHHLAWSAGAGDETEWVVERSFQGAAFIAQATVPVGQRSFDGNGLTSDVRYAWRLRARNADGREIIGAATAQVPTTPLAPGAITLVPGSASFALTWSDPAATEDSVRIDRSSDGTTWTDAVAVLPADSTSWNDSSLTPGITYHYRLRNQNVAGLSPATTVTGRLPVPVGASATAAAILIAPTTARVTWAVATGDVASYQIEHSVDGGAFAEVGSVTAPAVTFSHGSLPAETRHRYRIRALGVLGDAALSPISNEIASVPLPATGLTASAIPAGVVTLSWIDQSAQETGYVIERGSASTTWREVGRVAADVTTWSDSGRTTGSIWYYRVSAAAAVGASAPTPQVEIRIPVAPGAPTAVAALATAGDAITVTWGAATGDVTTYQVETLKVVSPAGSWTTVANVGPASFAFVHVPLPAESRYTYRVRAVGPGASALSAESAIVATRPAAPSLPSLLRSGGSATLAWSSSSAVGTGFVVERSGDGSTWIERVRTGMGTTLWIDTTLGNGTWHYRVRCSNLAGLSDPAGSVLTEGLIPVTAPGSITASIVGSTIHVSWSAAGGSVASYALEHALGSGAFTVLADLLPGTLAYDHGGLALDSTHRYQVRARDGAGGSAVSPVSAMVATQPLFPTGLTAVASGTAVTLTWTDRSQVEAGYRIESAIAGVWTVVSTLPANATTTVVSGLLPSTAYQFRVTAFNAAGSQNDATATATTGSVTDPGTGSGGGDGGGGGGGGGGCGMGSALSLILALSGFAAGRRRRSRRD